MYPIIIDYKKLKKSKNFIFNALKAEGVPALMKQYINLHLLPVYQKKNCIWKKNFPWSINKKNYNYQEGICPIAEEMNQKSFLGIELCKFEFTSKDINKIVKAFHKVWKEV